LILNQKRAWRLNSKSLTHHVPHERKPLLEYKVVSPRHIPGSDFRCHSILRYWVTPLYEFSAGLHLFMLQKSGIWDGWAGGR